MAPYADDDDAMDNGGIQFTATTKKKGGDERNPRPPTIPIISIGKFVQSHSTRIESSGIATTRIIILIWEAYWQGCTEILTTI